MTTKWYCETCGEEIDEAAIDDHESDGHDVRGFMVPDRLLSNDPWQIGASNDVPNDAADDAEDSSE
ncbi:MAG: hypothetical protein V5A23_07040 [Halobacteriales archaeon]